LGGRTTRRARLVIGTSVAILGLLAVACAPHAPQNSLKPAGPIARQEDNLFWLTFWIAAGVFFLVEGLLVFFLYKFRARSDRDAPVQVHGNRRLEIIWTIIPAALLAALAVPTMIKVFDVARKPVGSNVVHVNVTAHQWWWEYEYTDFKTADGSNLKAANELVIPAGRPIYLTMTSKDVIHSYWVPKLAGKQDVIPDRITHLNLEADAPGVFRGQCAEFCALSHANMRLRVIALAPADFDAWLDRELRPSVRPLDAAAAHGFDLFGTAVGGACITCHTIRGNPASQGAIVGPDLTHFGSRTSFAGSMLDMNASNIALWLTNPPAVKPGSVMKNYGLTQDEIAALVAYLQTLK